MTTNYEPPTIGSIVPLRSRFSVDPMIDFIGDLNSLLENKGLLSSKAIVPLAHPQYTVYLKDYLDKKPIRLHEGHWINGGEQIVVFQPETFLPFFFNLSGSEICRICDGKHSIKKILKIFKTKTPNIEEKELQTEIIKFFLLLGELGLIKL